MNEFIATLLQAVLVAAVPVCAAFIGYSLKALAAYLGGKSQNETARKYLNEAAEAISTAVAFTSQTYVDALKKSGQFDQKAQEQALQVALDRKSTRLNSSHQD